MSTNVQGANNYQTVEKVRMCLSGDKVIKIILFQYSKNNCFIKNKFTVHIFAAFYQRRFVHVVNKQFLSMPTCTKELWLHISIAATVRCITVLNLNIK